MTEKPDPSSLPESSTDTPAQRSNGVQPPPFTTFSNMRIVLAWVICLSVALIMSIQAWGFYKRPERPDGNAGHLNVDFSSQWLMGRMIVEGKGRSLYDRPSIRSVIERAYPRADEDPKQATSDVDQVMEVLVEGDGKIAPENIGGSLYPPVHAMLFAPLDLLPPRPAYRFMQVINLVLAFLLGWMAQRLSNGRVWWPVGTVVLLLTPAYTGAIFLGQNALLSLLVLTLGWWQLMCKRPVLAGVLWGLLAFKPVWAVAFLPLTLLTGRWRMALAMGATGLTLVALTLPLVGIQTWFDWLAVTRLATAGYENRVGWILMSRDLQGLVRRWYIDEPSAPLPTTVAIGVWLVVAAVTVIVAVWRRRAVRSYQGPGAAFMLLGGWLSGFHFMYYDTLLTALPMLLLFTQPEGKKLVPSIIQLLLIVSPCLIWLARPRFDFTPTDTYLLLGLWAWCGLQLFSIRSTIERGVDIKRTCDRGRCASPRESA